MLVLHKTPTCQTRTPFSSWRWDFSVLFFPEGHFPLPPSCGWSHVSLILLHHQHFWTFPVSSHHYPNSYLSLHFHWHAGLKLAFTQQELVRVGERSSISLMFPQDVSISSLLQILLFNHNVHAALTTTANNVFHHAEEHKTQYFDSLFLFSWSFWYWCSNLQRKRETTIFCVWNSQWYS